MELLTLQAIKLDLMEAEVLLRKAISNYEDWLVMATKTDPLTSEVVFALKDELNKITMLIKGEK
jgi:hypothetical protein